jgi:hypothetical protein
MRGVDANGFVSSLISDLTSVAAASFLGLITFRPRGHHRERWIWELWERYRI